MSEWERFAREDAESYICTDAGCRARSRPDRQAFLRAGQETADWLIRQVEDDLPGWSLAIEIGCGVGRLLLPHARLFGEVRGVDISPTMLARARALAAEQGRENVMTYLPGDPWNRPHGSADYVYSFLVFQHIADGGAIASYMTRTAGVLRPGGIAQMHFDTRARSLAYRVRQHLPDALLPATQRRGIRRIRRDADWVRAVIRAAGLEILRERDPGSADNWFVLRRVAP